MSNDIYVVLTKRGGPYEWSDDGGPWRKVFGPSTKAAYQDYVDRAEWGRDLGGYRPAYTIRKAEVVW